MNILPLLCLFQAFQWARAQSRTYLVTAPKILRLDAAETVVIQLFGYEQDSTVTVSLKSYPDKKETFATESVKLTAEKGHQGVVTLRLLPTDFPKDATNVFLEAWSSEFTKEEKLPVSRDNGFLFIQTDKFLYTPGQSVKVRVFSLSAALKPALRPVTLTFLDSEAMVVDIVDLKDVTGILSMQNPFKIPLSPKFGVWKIKATYTEEFVTTATTEFEVKEYVLPSISIIIQPEANYISAATFESFKVKVMARYIHGPPVVNAEVFLKFGYIDGSGTNILPGSLGIGVIRNSEAEFVLNILKVFEGQDEEPRTLQELDGKTFYVTVTVQELTGGISQDAELATVKFCLSPYSLALIATPPFIKPGLPYSVRVLVKDPLGQPVPQVPVKALVTIVDDEATSLDYNDKSMTRTSQEDGTVLFIYNIPPHSSMATFSLQTADSTLPPTSQAKLRYTAEAYKSINQRYLYIDWASYYRELNVGDYASILVYFHHHHNIPLRTFSYQIISKGKIVNFKLVQHVGSTNVQSINFQITADMVPSARFLVYYIMTGEQRAELVADSVWFSVKAKCVNGLKTELWAEQESYQPKDNLTLRVKAGQSSLVALSSIDMALYNLRAPSRDPMARTLRHIEQSDQGCGGGGGKDNADVFRLAGLTFITNANAKATSPEDETCSAVLRPKRSANICAEMTKKAKTYRIRGGDRKCCNQGVQNIPVLETCEARTSRLDKNPMIPENCKRIFTECCNFYKEFCITTTASQRTMARMELEIQFGFNAPRVRSFFPESWLWEVRRVTDRSGVLSIQKNLPDSLTTWEMKAVEMSSEGICVAEPLRVQVTQKVSVDIPVPYSVVRGEQIELRGSVYNQLAETSSFCVTLTAPQGVCLFQARAWGGASQRTPCTQRTLEKESVSLVTFTLMALEVGEHKLSFTLRCPLGSETIIKTLRVVPEGIKTEIHLQGTLDPQGVYGKTRRRLEFQNSVPPNLVPKSSVDRLLTINGEILGAVMAMLNDPTGLQRLTSLPRGSAEVELMGVFPVYYVYHHLETTGRWNLMGADAERSRLDLKNKLKEGITSLMSFKKKTEHSYSVWTGEEGSTWLTALVVKALGLVAEYVPVDRVSLCNSIFWLKSRRNPDGSFREESNYIPSKIMGAGADVTEKTAFLTSFTIIGIKNGMKVDNCQLLEFKEILEEAAQYLHGTFGKLKSTYVRAITAYALALVDQYSIPARQLYERLQNEANVKGNPAVVRFWEEINTIPGASKPNKVSAQSVETTAYVLLTTMLYGNMQYANPILSWLTQDQYYGGGFHSTQDTILTLEALTKYGDLVKHTELKMEIRASYRSKGDLQLISLSDKHPVATPIQVMNDDDVIVATGFSTGVSVANMKTVFYSTTQSNVNCYFDLKIDVHAPVVDSIEPMFMSPRIVACAKFKPPENEVYLQSSHTVMEIHLPTGVKPIQEDLDLMQKSLESRISHYEIQGDQVILQLNSVPSEDFLCVGFRIQELFRTGMASSSLFRVYEFNNPASQCFKPYYTRGERRLLRLCEEDECQCMAAECSSFKSPMDLSVTADERLKAVCQAHMKYAFKVKIESFVEEGDFVSYAAEIEDVYKKDTEDVKRGTEVTFVKKATCTDVDLLPGSQYLIMGSDVMQIEILRSYKYKYPLDSQTWVEKWPQECKGSPWAFSARSAIFSQMKKVASQRVAPRGGTRSDPSMLSPGSPFSTPRSRTPSPAHGPRSPASRPGLGSSLQLSMTEEESEDGADGEPHSDNDERRSPGVRYITEDLIKRVTKQDSLAFVRSLNLSLAKSGGKKFKFIENLEKCERLQVLNLSHNLIEKIEKLEKLHRLRELHLSHNRIRKIEGLEHMGNLQHLNLAGNNIEHLPLWLAKKLRSVNTLNLQRNSISSLHELSKLKPLKNLTELLLAENPVSNLPHYRLFLLFHLRTLERLDGQVITQQERELAYQRFHMEEVDRLEQDLEARQREVESLQEEQAIAVEELDQQGALNQSLKLQCQEQKQCQAELERELETKNQLLVSCSLVTLYTLPALSSLLQPARPAPVLDAVRQLKQKTMELTRACQKQYELEQELAFHKIDAKFEPLPYYPDQEVELDGGSTAESPYIGKARHKRNTLILETVEPDGRLGHTDTDAPGRGSPDSPGYGHAQVQAEERLKQLQREIENAEQQILRASGELRQLEEAVSQKRITEAEKEQLRQQLRRKISLLQELRGEAQALEVQLDRSRDQMSRTQGELDRLRDALDSLDPSDPRHAHVKAQVSSKAQQLDIMSRKYRELEGRLDDMLNRIAKETEEIKDLEQQLTDGQIAANETLKKDLEGIIAGLQEYLQGIKGQARRAQADCHRLEREKDALQRRLEDSEGQRSQLEIVAMDAESAREEVLRLEQSWTVCVRLRPRSEELGRLRRLSQMEQSALQAELDKERQAKENALVQMQLALEKQHENEKLLEQLPTLQEEHSVLRGQLSALQGALDEARGSLLNPQEVTQRLEDLRRSISSGLGGGQATRRGGRSGPQPRTAAAGAAQGGVGCADGADEARGRQGRLTQEAAALRDKLRRGQEEHRAACDSAAQAMVAAERREAEMEAELRRLGEELREMQEVQSVTEQRLQEVEEERDRLLAELGDRENQTKAEESRTQLQLRCLEKEMREMKRSMTTADKAAAQQLTAAKDQLRSLHGTVHKINQERAEDAEELEGFRMEAATAAQDLARAEAEIHLLQKLLKDREQQMHELDSNVQQQELEHVIRALDKQQAQTKQLWEQLAQAREDNRGNFEEVVEEIGVLRDTLAQQCSFVSNLGDPHRSRGCWYYVPSPQNPPSVGSQGTRDSGLGSQYPPSPERGRHTARRGRKEREEQTAPLAGGYWMYSPLRSRRSRTRGTRGDPRDSGAGSDGDSSVSGRHFTAPPGPGTYTVLPDGSALPHGAVIYAPPAAGLSVTPGMVVYGPPPTGAPLVYGPPPTGAPLVYGPPPTGAPLVYGPPPASFSTPLVPAGVLHCNVPQHQDLEGELAQLLGQKRKEEHAGADVQRLQDQRAELQDELQELRRAISRMRRRRASLAGSGSSLVEEVQQSLRQQGEVLGEVECVEKTLLRRRAELREADRLLLEAESDLKDTRAKTRETLQRYNKAQQHVGDTERELEELEKRAQDSATELVEANMQLRTLQEEVQELRRRRVAEERTLQEVEQVVESQDAVYRDLSSKVEAASERLEALQSELDQAESREARHLETLREAESMLGQRRRELDALSTEVAQQQEEVAFLDRKLGQQREEERLLQESGEQHRRSRVEVLKREEEEVQDLKRHIKELRADLETLSALKGELDSLVVERRARVSLVKQEVEREEGSLQSILAQISKHKAELKHVLEMVQLETSELHGVKLQHEQRLDQLEQSQDSLLKVRVELEQLAQVAQRQRVEGERQRRHLEQERAELESLQQEVGGAREKAEALRQDRVPLEEQCRNLEARRVHAERCLATAEEGARAAEAELSRLEAELGQMKREHKRARGVRQEAGRDAAAAQQQLEERRKELKGLEETLSDGRQRLQRVEEDVRGASRRHEELLEEQRIREEELEKAGERVREGVRRGEELEAELGEKHARLQQQEKSLQVLQQDALDTEELQAQRLHKLQAQLQAVEGALTERGEQLRQATAGVSGAEEQERLGRELSAREEELEALRGELTDCQEEVQHLQEVLLTERRSAERRLTALRARGQAERDHMEQERDRLQRELVAVDQAASENHQRARDLQEELNGVSQELLGLKDKLRSQEDGETRRRGIKEAMHSLRSEVRAEIRELETPPSDASDTESHKENDPHYTPSLGRVTFSTKDEQWRGEALREQLRQQEDHLKAQLRRRMWSQEEALSQRRQQTEGSLQGLRRRVDKLDKLLSGSADSLTLIHSEPPLKHGRSDVPEAGRSLGTSARSCSPVRLDPALPEKDQGSSW
ncbi:hypothetical protein SKAU_G00005040 [Synaphobranchus kaupii]|uniref:Uncharacterized protein n=1 Tax=Synaphobranchus kaupii TaxID=118154 RepID=A0A9Q1G8Y4_SYNKA|nr:hypothetical protein SKAU_G00005040 [Synaphobranchus kaupii]